MVDISSQDNKINITVSSSGNTANTNVTPDYAQYYSEKSKEWAISNRIVDNTDYSSKYYANESKKQADISTAKATEVVESGNNAVSNIESARDNAITDVNTAGATQVALATEQATIATNKANEVVASGNEALSNIDTAKSEALTEIETLHSSSVTDITGLKNTSIADITNLKNTSISDITTTKDNAITTITTQETTSKNNVIATGNEQVARIEATGNNYDNLTHKNITNCLLEVPQRIKLELNDGVLTLKAGSQVIVPNGFEADGTTPKFDEVAIENDLTVTNTWGTAEKMAIFVSPDATNISMAGLARNSSGTTAPTTTDTRRWYDTDTNLVKSYVGGSYTGNNFSFPIAICTKTSASNDNLLASIDQVFNGMGYIGSTVWVDKGVKGLSAEGQNDNGTWATNEIATSNVITRTLSGTETVQMGLFINAIGKAAYYYVSEDGFLYNNKNVKQSNCISFADFTITNGQITSFQPKLPFRAVDYNDKSEISGWGMPSSKYIDLTLGASGSKYTAPANGWVQAVCNSSSDSPAFIEVNTEYASSTGTRYQGCWGRATIPVTKGRTFDVYYGGAGFEIKTFRFTYAEGEV